jgi:protein-S-isoprenylcysteine O-methyltransferase Ste14
MSRYTRWAKKEHSFGVRITAGILAGVVFLILLPLLIVKAGPRLDTLFGFQGFPVGPATYLLGGLMVGVGLFFGLWSNYVQFTRGRGTPLPVMPTQELLIQGPYRYCRNPMTLGTVLAYLGIGVLAGTVSGIVIVICFGLLLVLYITKLEEGELAERFGEAYLQYKREVPFLIPRLLKHKG